VPTTNAARLPHRALPPADTERPLMPPEVGDRLGDESETAATTELEQQIEIECPAERLVETPDRLDVDSTHERPRLGHQLRADTHERRGIAPTSVQPQQRSLRIDVAASPVDDGRAGSIEFSDNPNDAVRGEAIVIAKPGHIANRLGHCVETAVDCGGKASTGIVDDLVDRCHEGSIEIGRSRLHHRDVRLTGSSN